MLRATYASPPEIPVSLPPQTPPWTEGFVPKSKEEALPVSDHPGKVAPKDIPERVSSTSDDIRMALMAHSSVAREPLDTVSSSSESVVDESPPSRAPVPVSPLGSEVQSQSIPQEEEPVVPDYLAYFAAQEKEEKEKQLKEEEAIRTEAPKNLVIGSSLGQGGCGQVFRATYNEKTVCLFFFFFSFFLFFSFFSF